MNINYNDLEQQVIKALEENKIWILSTSENDIVTSRAMSIINDGLNIYFQTNKCYIKYQQMKKNKNVALCYNNISIEGNATGLVTIPDQEWFLKKEKYLQRFEQVAQYLWYLSQKNIMTII